MKSVVYFIRPVGCLGPVKIGCTTLIHDRIRALNAWSPLPLEIVATINGSYDLERRLHALFFGQHQHGEWFVWTPELGAVIDSVNADTFEATTLPEPIWISNPKKHREPKARRVARPKREKCPARAKIEQECPFRDEALLRDVTAYCERAGIPASLFGRKAVGDPRFVFDLRKGRIPRAKVSRRVRAFILEAA